MSSIISAIGISNPAHRFPQDSILDFMIAAHGLEDANAGRLKKLYDASGIAFRHSVIEDFGREKGDYTFFGNGEALQPFPTTQDRGLLYEQTALTIAMEAVANCLKPAGTMASEITHLITVSCTGMYAPGLDIELVEHLGLKPTVERTC
ncbi:MAG: type III polyketide synthase, partial [Pedobacter sp.]